MAKLYMPPNRADRWVVCTGSPTVEHANRRQRDPDAAQEGIDLHKYVEKWLQSAQFFGPGAEPPPDELDADQREAVTQCYTAVVDTLVNKGADLGQLAIEQLTPMHYLEDQNGYPDVVWIDNDNRVIHVWDWKFGRSRVDARKNWQLIATLYGLSRTLNGLQDQQWFFEATIVQPNCFQKTDIVDTWAGRLSDLRGYFNAIDLAVEEARTSPQLRAGEHCRRCSGIAGCPAAYETAGRFLYYAQQIDVIDLPAEKQAAQIDTLQAGEKYIKSLSEAIKDTVTGVIESGQNVPGWTLETAKGRRAWKADSEVIGMFKMLGLGDLVREKPLGITMVEKEAKKRNIDATVIEQLVTRTSRTKLTRTSDTSAGKAFGSKES